MQTYWTSCSVDGWYEIWVNGKIHAEYLTIDELLAMWKQMRKA